MNLSNKIRQIRPFDLSLAILVMVFLFGFYGASLWQLFSRTTTDESITTAFIAIINDDYILHVVRFSFLQAFLSAVLSIGFGLLTAHALYYHDFIGKKWLLKLLSLSMVLPVLVAIFGLLGVYGKSGWFTNLMNLLHINWQPNIYGLSGILIAHVFFNLPLSAKILLNSLNTIPNQQRKLSAQLGITDFNFIRLAEWAYLKPQLPSLFTLVFMLCFTSFTIVLTLGGSPKYTTLEVAIYQAVTFNFELQLAGLLAMLQFTFCFGLFWLSSLLSKPTETTANVVYPYRTPLAKPYQYGQKIILVLAILFICVPLLQVIISGLNWQAWIQSLQNQRLWTAVIFSLSMAICAGLLCIIFTMMVLLGARQLYWLGNHKTANTMVNTGMMVLSVPTLVLAVGLFLLLQQFSMSMSVPVLFAIVVLCNALMAMPFALRILENPMYNNMSYYERLCQSLGVRGFNRLRYIEWQTLKQPLQNALALATALSLGDFTAIALFGNQHFTSLPHLLYQQLGSYRSEQASVTAFILLMLSAGIFLLIEQTQTKTGQIKTNHTNKGNE